MIEIKSPRARRYLQDNWAELSGGLRHLANLAAVELGDEIAEAIPTSIDDGIVRRITAKRVDQRVNDLIAYLGSQRHGP